MKQIKQLICASILVALALTANAQAPQLINYQAVARNAGGSLLTSTIIGVRLTVHDSVTAGTIQYQETQTVTTNAYGLFTLQVGGGAIVLGTMSGILWGSGNKYLQVEIDPTGGSSYVDMGAQQLVSVPYSLYAENSGSAATLTGSMAMGGDVVGTNSAATVIKLQGNDISSITPTAGQILQWTGTTWAPSSITDTGTVTSVMAGAGLVGGTITSIGSISMPDVGTAATYGSATQVPVFITDAQGRVTSVTNTAITGPTYTGGTGVAIAGTIISAQDTTALWNANELQGKNVSTTSPATGQVLQWSGSAWVPTTLSSGWNITGNSGINPATNFIGTTDTNALRLRVNNQWAGELNPKTGNASFGVKAGQAATTGYSSIAVGTNALYSNTTGSNLIAIGDSALYNQNGGYWNLAIGSKALFTNTTGNNNTAIGMVSLYYNTTGYQNTAVGLLSLNANTTGYENTATGAYSLPVNTTGNGNTATGNGSLGYNTSGNWNTATGEQSLYLNTTGNNNTAIGVASIFSNTSGTNNTAIGSNSLYSDTTGSNNSAIGYQSLYSNTTGYSNTAIGLQSLYSNTTGYQNTAAGVGCLYSSTTGYKNTGTGISSLFSNTTGYNNTANGSQSLYNNTTGYQNTAIGVTCLNFNTTGYDNTGTGIGSLYSNTTGIWNTADGAQSLDKNTTGNYNTAIGSNSLYNDTSGINNTAVGYQSLYTNVTGSNNTAIGYAADVSTDTLTNSMALGNYAIVNVSNKVVIGNSSVTVIGGYSNWTNLSDGRFKTNIQENVPGLDFILKLRPVTYQFEARKLEHFLGRPDSMIQKLSNSYDLAESQVRTGFIAQDVEKAAQEAGYDFSGIHKPTNDKDNYSLAYAEFTVPLVKAVQEQQKTIIEQQANILDLQNQLAELMKRVKNLENQK